MAFQFTYTEISILPKLLANMQNDISPMTNQAGPVTQTPTELEMMSIDMYYPTPVDNSRDMSFDHTDYCDSDPISIDDDPDSWITEEQKAGLDEFAHMLEDMGIAHMNFNASVPTADDEAGSGTSPISVDVQSPLSSVDSDSDDEPDEPEDPKRWPSINPFSDEILLANVTFCHEKAPSEELDSLIFFAMEYVRSVRFLKVKKRWSKMRRGAWMREVDLLTKAVTKRKSKLQLWRPLHQTLVLYHSNVGDVAKNRRVLFKRFIMAHMAKVARLQIQANKEAVEELLARRKIRLWQPFCTYVRKVVAKDCSNRGSLLLGKVAEFQNLTVAMPRNWFWVD
ncbi:hypothetical protein TUN199_02640 [Pyrenophora tritici-repentis]|nr:hypothetical protein Alg130_02450 [Pyrenophora tritici-repentis]KAI0625338.1 hypothetical protein TUN199_02640 [Pyrenophora tritici-repentis]